MYLVEGFTFVESRLRLALLLFKLGYVIFGIYASLFVVDGEVDYAFGRRGQ